MTDRLVAEHRAKGIPGHGPGIPFAPHICFFYFGKISAMLYLK